MEALINLNRSTTSCWSAIVPYFTLPVTKATVVVCGEQKGCLGAERRSHRGIFVGGGGKTDAWCLPAAQHSYLMWGAAEIQTDITNWSLSLIVKNIMQTFHRCLLVEFVLTKWTWADKVKTATQDKQQKIIHIISLCSDAQTNRATTSTTKMESPGCSWAQQLLLQLQALSNKVNDKMSRRVKKNCWTVQTLNEDRWGVSISTGAHDWNNQPGETTQQCNPTMAWGLCWTRLTQIIHTSCSSWEHHCKRKPQTWSSSKVCTVSIKTDCALMMFR